MFDRLAAAVFSACAALATFAAWVFFHSHAGGEHALPMFKQWAWPIGLAAAIFGFIAGSSLTGSFWGNVWETRSEPEPLLSLRSALTLIVVAAIGYGIYTHVMH